LDLVKNTPKGKLVNPYKDTQAAVVAAGSQFFTGYSCSGCHGGGGGGGICPPLINGVWIYGGSDDSCYDSLRSAVLNCRSKGTRAKPGKRSRADAGIWRIYQECRRSLEDTRIRPIEIRW
jgi:mono/diheme cytochrome c family protein